MKNKFLKCLFFVALPPILLLAGVQFYFLSNPAPVPKAPPAASQPPLDLPAAQAQLQTVASSFLSPVKKVS